MARSFGDIIITGKIAPSEAKQCKWKIKKTKSKTKTKQSIRKFLEFDNRARPISKTDKQKNTFESTNILSQVKPGSTSENWLHAICQIIYTLY